MRLRRLEILGFKSFAEKTKLHFDAGITAIVGPNGCGKSNIADAFRWVLGEQSAKSMRGVKMPDVIFAGTTHRKPLNFAEVTITLSDIEGKLPIDYEEVSVTRRLHRSGESDYFINRHPVRLKDVQSLFLDSGMGKDAYSIFEQGKIDQVINFSPLERRYIFEEAAGIVRFLQRKKEALRKLELADQNMVRVKDIHLEVEKQIVILEQQAEKAKIYKENKALLEKLEKGVLLAKWGQVQKKIFDGKKKTLEQKEQIDKTNHQLDSFQTQFQEGKSHLAEGERFLRAKSEEVFKARSHKEIKNRENQNNQDRLKEILAKEKRWQHELEIMAERKKVRQSERTALQAQLKELEKDILVREKTLASQSEKVMTKENLLSTLREQQQVHQQEVLRLLKSQNQWESELKQTMVRLESMQDRRITGQQRLDKLSQAMHELSNGIEEKNGQLKEASKIVDEQKNHFAVLEQTLRDLVEEIQKAQVDLDLVQQELTEGRARQKVLLRLREEMEGFSAGTKRLLQESANPKSPLYNKLKGLYETLVPEAGSEKALAAVMRSYIQTLVVETNNDFHDVMLFAKQENLKDFSLFCMETKMNKSALETQKDKTPLLKRVSDNPLSRHFLGNVWMVHEGLAEWNNVKTLGSEVCSEEGSFIDRQRVVFYKTQGENNIFLREAELKTWTKKLKEAEDNKLQLDNFLKALHQKKNQFQAERFELDKNIRRQEMKIVEINFALQKLNGDQKNMQNESHQLQTDLEGLTLAIEKLFFTLENLKQKSQEAHLKVTEAQKRALLLNEEFEKHLIEHKQEMQELKDKETSYHKAADEKHRLQHALHVLDVKDLESHQQEKRLEEEIELCQSLQTDSQFKGKEFEKILQEVESSLAEVVAACAELEQEVAARKTLIEHLESKMQDKRLHQKKLETTYNQLEIQTAQCESQSHSLQNELLERFQLSIEEAQQIIEPLEQSLEITEKRVRTLRQEMQNTGDINMTSIEDCDKHKVRYEFLNQQIDDLNVSKKELIEIITQLDSESRKIFKETFDKISVNFKKNFKILFNGGEADLQFTETEDVLEAGIEIIAKPPGKQMRSINLLSGGEKCLTAVALLFAIFEVKPSPFCILDEIDAPLDDTNVERFANIVKQYIDKCQFIIITHNKRTMAIADVLFGVSMEEKGVSKLLSIEFSKDETVVPALV